SPPTVYQHIQSGPESLLFPKAPSHEKTCCFASTIERTVILNGMVTWRFVPFGVRTGPNGHCFTGHYPPTQDTPQALRTGHVEGKGKVSCPEDSGVERYIHSVTDIVSTIPPSKEEAITAAVPLEEEFWKFQEISLNKLRKTVFQLKKKSPGDEALTCCLVKPLFDKRPTLDRIASTSQRNDDGYLVTYSKSRKPHTIGEKLILPAVEEVLKTVLHKPASDIIKRIPLSNNTVERRIDEMSYDIESFLCNYLQTTHFSIQLDESTLPDNAALLLAYVRFIMNQEIYEELLFARTLITDTKGESIFHVLKDYFIEKAIPLSNIISVATDGAPAMVGRYRGFKSYLKQSVSGVLAIDCVIHRQHLVAKNLSVRLHESLHLVIDAVNRIRSKALNTRLFAQLCEENDEHFHQLLLHTGVRWLSKGLCLTRFLHFLRIF
ncbi:unnamed protein product, partial [Acanthoscelides obtectus]